MANKKSSKKFRDIPKKLTTKDASLVKGGVVGLSFAKLSVEYKPQKSG